MTDASGGRKGKKWLPALIAALVIVALGAWWFNSSQDRDERSDAMAADPNAQATSTGVETGQPGVPAGTNAAALAGGDRGNASAIENADAARMNAPAGADPTRDAMPGVPGQGAPTPTGSDAQPVRPQ